MSTDLNSTAAHNDTRPEVSPEQADLLFQRIATEANLVAALLRRVDDTDAALCALVVERIGLLADTGCGNQCIGDAVDWFLGDGYKDASDAASEEAGA